MLTDQTRSSLDKLVADLIDQQLEPADREQLNFLLRDSDACRQRFNALMDLQVGMIELAGQSDAPTVELSRNSNPTFGRQSWLLWSVIASAAALLIAVGLSRFTSDISSSIAVSTDQHDTGSVRIAQASAAETFDSVAMAAGQTLTLNHETILTSGMVQLVFPNGAEVVIEGPSVFTVVTADRLSMTTGRCSVYAPEGAEGFRVDTPQAHVIDLGTRFSIDVDEVGQTDVQVIEGLAQVQPLATSDKGEQVLLKDGQARRFGKRNEVGGESIEFESASYRTGLPDRIVRYAGVDPSPPVSLLASVTVQRGGEMLQYDAGELIGIEVIHFMADENRLNVAAVADDDGLARATLESDRNLATGLINPGGSITPLVADPIMSGTGGSTPGFGFRFKTPVINRVGPDVVLLELQSKLHAVGGDGFHVSPLRFSPDLRSHTIKRYDITMRSAEALPAVAFQLPFFTDDQPLLSRRLSDAARIQIPNLQFYVLAVGIDLTDLGYKMADAVEGLFMQDDLDDDQRMDPVFIGGLPDMKETVQ